MAQIPLEIVAKLDGAVAEIQRFRATTEKELEKINKATKLISFIEIGRAAIDAGKMIAGAFEGFIHAASEAEDSLNKLNIAMKLSGDYSAKASADFEEFAKSIQAQTGIDDDLIVKNIALAKSYGFTNDESKKVIEAATQLSAVTGQDLTSSLNTLNASYFGNVKALQKTFPEIRAFTRDQLAAGAAVDFFNTRFAGAAAAAATTFSGRMAIAKGSIANFTETLGQIITQNPQVLGTISAVGKLFIEFEKIINRNKETIAGFVTEGINFVIRGLNALLQAFDPILVAFSYLQKAFAVATSGAAALYSAISGGSASKEVIKSIGDSLDKELKGIDEVTKKRREMFKEIQGAVQDTSQKIQTAQKEELKISNSLISASVARQEQIQEETNLYLQQVEAIKKANNEKAAGQGFAAFVAPKEILKTPEGKPLGEKEQASANQQANIAAGLGAVNQAMTGAQGAAKAISSVIGGIANTLLPGIGGVVSQIIEVFAQGPEKVKEFFTAFITSIPDIITNIVLSIPALIEAVINSIPVLIEKLIAAIPQIIYGIIESIPRIIDAIIAAIPRIITAIILQVPKIITELTFQAPRIITAIVMQVPHMVTEIVNEFVRQVPRIIEEMVSQIGKQVGGFFSGSSSKSGIPIIGGVVDAIGGIFGFAEGGIVPYGFPNDSFPAALSSGEAVIDRSVSGRLLNFLDKYESGGSGQQSSAPTTIILQIGEKQLADVILNLNRQGYRTA